MRLERCVHHAFEDSSEFFVRQVVNESRAGDERLGDKVIDIRCTVEGREFLGRRDAVGSGVPARKQHRDVFLAQDSILNLVTQVFELAQLDVTGFLECQPVWNGHDNGSHTPCDLGRLDDSPVSSIHFRIPWSDHASSTVDL